MSDHVPGSIRSLPAYVHAKLLDHQDWQKGDMRLPRSITPSDIDTLFEQTDSGRQPTMFDNNGVVMFVEWSRLATQWEQLPKGQRWAYESCIRDRTLPCCAVLGWHEVAPESGRIINTRTDIASFNVMVWDWGPVFSTVFVGNERWQRFVFGWMGCAGKINVPSRAKEMRRQIIGASAGMHMRPSA